MNVVGVECNADRYFFGRLLDNKLLIRKERNDIEVIKGVFERSKGNFSIGIIDIDKNKKIPSSFAIIDENVNTTILKHKTNSQFIVLIGPRQFEHWINDFLKSNNTTVENFGFETFNDFMRKSKSLKPENEPGFINLINFVFENFELNENHISKLKKQLKHIIDKKYNFNIDEFLKI